jgi:hypothetical protein
LFNWAHFQRAKAAFKLHLRLDHDGYLPSFATIAKSKGSYVKVARQFQFDLGTIVVGDRGYNGYPLLGRWTAQGVYFVTRIKEDTSYEVIREKQVPTHHILKDEESELKMNLFLFRTAEYGKPGFQNAYISSKKPVNSRGASKLFLILDTYEPYYFPL